MKLYTFPVAPNPTKVALYVAEKRAGGAKIDLEIVEVNLAKGEHKLAENLVRNPFGRLPFLELDDGEIILESLAIIEYLEELHPAPPMIGSTPLERARVRALERTIDLSVLFPAGIVVHSTNSPIGLPPSPQVAERFQARLPAGMNFVEDLLEDGRPYLAGDHPTIADCTMAAALQFARFGKVDVGHYPRIEAWQDAYRARAAIDGIIVF